MKKIIPVLSIAALLFTACSGGTNHENSSTSLSTDSSGTIMSSVKYTCTMHPEIISDTPGHCPKCGMELVPMEPGMMHDSTHMHSDSMMK